MTTVEWRPVAVRDTDLAFGGDMGKLLPTWESIPEEFRRRGTKWNEIQARWFFDGLPKETEFKAKDGVDVDLALRHLSAIQRSWAPKHEHKGAGVAYLMSLWFDDVKLPDASRSLPGEVGL